MHFPAHLEVRPDRNGGLHGDAARKHRDGFNAARRREKSGFNSTARKRIPTISNSVEAAETQITLLREMPVGARLIVKCRKDWRSAVVSSVGEDKATLIVCSASGGTYRLRRPLETQIFFDGKFSILHDGCEDIWRDNFIRYDSRW